ncbi:hypothetical protein [Nitrosomonas communis]|uniref:Uncharacterized protein n=1 Tax=Nitrosomonas communis TaxID=44574 RepID=A0A1I4V3F8_9PROT|nr:hypothetical protein [Nitrosomonas communis]SFM95728.1 hypothetical protein SAMN05421863_107518 [Nitrosomonas communis]
MAIKNMNFINNAEIEKQTCLLHLNLFKPDGLGLFTNPVQIDEESTDAKYETNQVRQALAANYSNSSPLEPMSELETVRKNRNSQLIKQEHP